MSVCRHSLYQWKTTLLPCSHPPVEKKEKGDRNFSLLKFLDYEKERCPISSG